MNIREVAGEDNPFLAKLIRRVFEEYHAPQKGTVYDDPSTDDLYKLFQKEGAILRVAEVESTIAGCCGIYPTRGLPEHCVELVKFYLLKEFRGLGIGKQLINRSLQSAKEMGYSRVYIESMPAFSNAVRIYKKIGFYDLPHPLGHSGHDSCSIWMMKDLDD